MKRIIRNTITICILITFLTMASTPHVYASSDSSVEISEELLAKLKEELREQIELELKLKIAENLAKEIKNELKEDLKTEILEEITEDVKLIVKQEVDTYLANYKPAITQKDFQKLTRVEYADPANMSPEKQNAIRQMIQEILDQDTRVHRITDDQLDSYTGASIEMETSIPGGYDIPRAEYRLAQAISDNDQSGHSQSGNGPTAQDIADATSEGEPQAESIERTLQQKGGILIPKGTLIVEPSITYTEFSSNAININGFVVADIFFLGTQAVETIKRNVFIPNISIKYGLFHNFQTEFKIPGRYQHERRVDINQGETTDDFAGLGDAELSFSRQIFWEKGWIPDTLATVSVKSRSGRDPYNNDRGVGTGHVAVRGGLVAVKSSDPAVIFGGLNYTVNFERDDIRNIGTIKPGDTIGFSIGTAIALSYQTAINFGYDQSLTYSLKRNGLKVPSTFLNSASLKTGFTWALDASTSIDFSVGIGLTTDAPDVTVSLRVPHTF